MAKTFSLTKISECLELQQEIVYMLDTYSIPTLLDSDKIQNINDFSNYLADSVMYHIFTNIRNIYQDSIFISQGLIEAKPYYISTSLFYALREADEFLTDLAYIVNDKKKQGNEYIRYLLFVLRQEIEVLEKMGFHTNVQTTKELYDTLLSIFPKLKPKDRGQWTDTTRKCKLNQGLKSDITTTNLTDYINNFHKLFSFEAHGNHLTFTSSTPEDNKPKLKSFLSFSISSLQFVIYITIKYYFDFYLNKPTIYTDLAKFIRDIDEKMDNLRN